MGAAVVPSGGPFDDLDGDEQGDGERELREALGDATVLRRRRLL